MDSLSNPDWYDTLKEDQPFRTRNFTEAHVADISTKAVTAAARSTFFKRKRVGAVMIAAVACTILLYSNMLTSNVAPVASTQAGGTIGTLDPHIRDRLINSSSSQAQQKEILSEKRVNDHLELIYSVPSNPALSSALSIDILRWTDYGGDRSIGTGLDGWSHVFRGQAGGIDNLVMTGVSWDGKITYDGLNLFTGKLLQSSIAGIRVVDGSGKAWDAQLSPGPNGSRYWFVDMLVPVNEFRIEALSEHGTVLSSYSPE
ncbi:hypothetical protein [Paenibacillus sp. GCM10012306]|uniref:hypothetical protein n=1 Tax=Paenibacillus sp. GCM10012306 TaxID=3317342 RepID=UPI003615501A